MAVRLARLSPASGRAFPPVRRRRARSSNLQDTFHRKGSRSPASSSECAHWSSPRPFTFLWGMQSLLPYKRRGLRRFRLRPPLGGSPAAGAASARPVAMWPEDPWRRGGFRGALGGDTPDSSPGCGRGVSPRRKKSRRAEWQRAGEGRERSDAESPREPGSFPRCRKWLGQAGGMAASGRRSRAFATRKPPASPLAPGATHGYVALFMK